MPAHIHYEPFTDDFDFSTERLTIGEAAAYLGVSVQFLRNDAVTHRHNIPRVKIGRKVFYLKRLLNAHVLKSQDGGTK